MAVDDHLADPLERRSVARGTVCLVTVAVGGAFLVSLAGAMPRQLPGIALASPLLLHLERAIVVGAAVAVLLIFVARGWAGSFPSKISTTGVEYLAQSAANEAIGHGDRSRDVIGDIEAKQLELASSLRKEIQALENRLTKQI